jgi:hypothetical protein
MNSDQVEIRSERVDDIPMIVEWLKQMEIGKWIDQKLSNRWGPPQLTDLLYPNGWLYILIKLIVLALAIALWFTVTAAPVA